jgi:hypothetical protein
LETFFSIGCGGAFAAPFFGWGDCLTDALLVTVAVAPLAAGFSVGAFVPTGALASVFFFKSVFLPFFTRVFGRLFTVAFFSGAGFFAATLITGFPLVLLTNNLKGFTPFLGDEEAFPEDLPDLDGLDIFFNG